MKITRLKKYYLDALIFLVAFLYLFPWGYIEKDAYSALVSYDDMHEDEVSDAPIHNFVSDTNKAESLYSTLQAVGYQLDGIKNGFQTVPHVFLPKIPKDIKIIVEKQTTIKINGADKQQVGMVASQIKSLRVTEPYKGKGIKEKGEYILRKEGKKK